MFRRATGWLAVVCAGYTAGSACAGFYDPAKPTSPILQAGQPVALPWELFRDQIDETLRIAVLLQPSKLRKETIARRDQLLKIGGKASATDLAELGFLQWRLRDAGALETLSRAKSADPRSFWSLANLAAYYQATGQYSEAASHAEAAMMVFPSPWPGNAADGTWFRHVEKTQQALLRARMREAGGTGGRLRPANDVDPIFPVQFVSPNGTYVAGKLTPSEQGKLPPDALPVVQQLLLWFPEDTRLLWLLGEVYNAAGDVRAADAIFDMCVGSRRFESAALRDHRRIVKVAVAELAAATPPQPTQPTESFLPDTSTIWWVSGIGGAVFILLGFLQFRELIRRRRSSARPLQ